jgi:hypothetical protein
MPELRCRTRMQQLNSNRRPLQQNVGSHFHTEPQADECVCKRQRLPWHSSTYPPAASHKHNPLMTHARLNRISKVDPFSQAHSPTDWQTHVAKHSSMQSKTKGSFSSKCCPHSNSAKSPSIHRLKCRSHKKHVDRRTRRQSIRLVCLR